MLTVTETSLKLFYRDLWKDSRYLDIVERDGETLIRRYSDNSIAIPEEHAFITRLKRKSRLRIPEIRQVTDKFIAFRYLTGTRAFNLLMDLRALFRSDQNNSFRELGAQLLEILRDDLADFQATMLTDSEFTRNKAPYPVREKLSSLYQLLTAILPQTCQYSEIEEDLNKIASVYEQNSDTPFRDATPKNMIVSFPALFQKQFQTYADRLQATKKACLSGELGRKLCAENIYHIDFSSCHFLCPKSDDWIALKEHESSAWLMPRERTMNPEQSIGSLCARFVRFSRFAGRKLAYRLLNSSGYQVRFLHDNEAGYFLTLSDICQYLRMHGIIRNGRLAGLMNDLFGMSRFQPDTDYLQKMLPVERKRTYYTDVFPN